MPPATAPQTPRRDAYEFEAPQFYDFAGSTPPLPASDSSWFDRQPAHSPFHSNDDNGGGANGRPADTPAAHPSPIVVHRASSPAARTPHTPGRRSMLGLSVVSTADLAGAMAEESAIVSPDDIPIAADGSASTEPTCHNGSHDALQMQPLDNAQSPHWPSVDDGALASDSPQRDVFNSDSLDDPFAETPAGVSDLPAAPVVETLGPFVDKDSAADTHVAPPTSPSASENRGAGTKRRVLGGTPLAMRTTHCDLGQRAQVEHTAEEISTLNIGTSAKPPAPSPPQNVFAASSPRRTSPRGSDTLGISLAGYSEAFAAAGTAMQPSVRPVVPLHRVVPDEPKLGRVRPSDRMRLERLKTAAPLLPARSTKPLTVPSEFSFATSRRVSTRAEHPSALPANGAPPKQHHGAAPAQHRTLPTRPLTVPISPMLSTRSRSRSSETIGNTAASASVPRGTDRPRVPMHAIRVATSKERSVPASPAVRKVAPTRVAPIESSQRAVPGSGARPISVARPYALAPHVARAVQQDAPPRDPRVFPPPPRSSRPLTVPVSPMFSSTRRMRGAPDTRA